MKLYKIEFNNNKPSNKRLTVNKDTDFILAIKNNIGEITLEDEEECLVTMTDFEFDGYEVYKLKLTDNKEYVINDIFKLFVTVKDCEECDVDYAFISSDEPITDDRYRIKFSKDWISGYVQIDDYDYNVYYSEQEVKGNNMLCPLFKCMDLSSGVPTYREIGGDLSADILMLEYIPTYKVYTMPNWSGSITKNKQNVETLWQAGKTYNGIGFIKPQYLMYYKYAGGTFKPLGAGTELQLSGNLSVTMQ